MDLELLFRLHQEHHEYYLTVQHFLDYHAELNRINILEQLEHIRRNESMHHCRHNNTARSLTSFKIKDILCSSDNDENESKEFASESDFKSQSRNSDSSGQTNCVRNETRKRKTAIVRPWSTSPKSSPCPSVETNLNYTDPLSEDEIDVEGIDTDHKKISERSPDFMSPLDALVEMSNKAFKGLHDLDSTKVDDLLNKSQIPKKKRKTRTAFSNQQIYELEKRFLYQKYLTPADRDEIANKLGLSSAQVITWFQNRRAKFKRDIEEMKNDVGSVRSNLSMNK